MKTSGKKIVKVSRKYILTEWNEGSPDDGGDGYWILLKSGWKWAGDPVGCTHGIHEDTKRMAYKEGVLPCFCNDCKI